MTERRAGVARGCGGSAGVLAASIAGVGCTDSHGMVPPGSTETGNPPVIDTGSVALVVSENAVHVVGDPGAVTPPEGTVEITVVATGKKITGMVKPDGSFDVQVDGTLDDVFEVRVVHDGKSSEVITVMRGGAMVGPMDASMRCRCPWGDRPRASSSISGSRTAPRWSPRTPIARACRTATAGS